MKTTEETKVTEETEVMVEVKENFFRRNWKKIGIVLGIAAAATAVIVIGTKKSYNNGYEDGKNSLLTDGSSEGNDGNVESI